jgi:hypothetical protein
MKHSFTAVIEQANTYTADFDTEPYETGWATEARWFVRVLDIAGESTGITLTPQISPDGLTWCDEGSAPIRFEGTGMISIALREFGHWLRLRATLGDGTESVKVLIYLALKE